MFSFEQVYLFFENFIIYVWNLITSDMVNYNNYLLAYFSIVFGFLLILLDKTSNVSQFELYKDLKQRKIQKIFAEKRIKELKRYIIYLLLMICCIFANYLFKSEVLFFIYFAFSTFLIPKSMRIPFVLLGENKQNMDSYFRNLDKSDKELREKRVKNMKELIEKK